MTRLGTEPPARGGRRRSAIPSAGERFGHYRIQRILGDGGMGVVLRAHDEPLERDVALKLIQPELLGQRAIREAFLEEARAMASIRHPNVAQIYALGDEGGHPYFAMELFDGGNLEAQIRAAGAMPPVRALPIVRGVARALAAIHRRGRLHGDVKPPNVLLSAEGERVALTDMGLSHVLGDEGSGIVRGTPAYLAPERVTGAPVPVWAQPRQDVYALAVLAFELLVGRLPFVDARADRLLEMHAQEPPPEPSAIRPELARFDAPLLRALDKNPLTRTESALTLFEELEAAHAQGPDTGRLRFLVVDDDGDWREMLTAALIKRFPGAQVDAAADGARGIDAARACRPDVALIDLDMPALNGVELTGALRELAPAERLPIVVLSGQGGASDWKVLRELGADRFFLKPTPFDELCDSIRRLLDGRVAGARDVLERGVSCTS